MTFLSAAGEGVDVGNVAGYIAGYQAEGLSATAALSAFRAVGGSVRTQTWYRAWGEVEGAGAAAGPLAGLSPETIPQAGDFTDWAVGNRPGLLSHDVMIFFRDEEGEVRTTYWSVQSSSPLAIQDVTEAAIEEFSSFAAESETGRGQVALGAVVHGLFRMTGYRP